MRIHQWISRRVSDVRVGAIFLTRLPLVHGEPIVGSTLSVALWTGPLIGAAVGALGAAVYGFAQALNLPPLPCATLAIAATAVATGCLHEDGLADTADGFGGGATRERKLEIMRDSRTGTYGVCALLISFLLRVGALASIAESTSVAAALIGAGAAARGPLPLLMMLVPPARADGMSAYAGAPPAASAATAALLGLGGLVVALGLKAGFIALLGLGAVVWFMAWLCRRQINGQTGDVLGALEQVSEMTVLLVAAAAISWGSPA